jgi:LmbE family N-acetylglucosaminyl deacetylase
MNKVLILSPHPDDILFGCGATVNKFIEEGKEVYCVVFSYNDQGFNQGEMENSILALGIKRENLIIWDYKVRSFWENRQNILEDLLKLRATIAPDLVLCHSRSDRHQDHKVVCEEAFRAFKEVSIWGYELPWNCRDFKADIFVPLNRRHLDAKLKALSFIESQGERRYYSSKRREANLIANGERCGKDFAEVFESISQII